MKQIQTIEKGANFSAVNFGKLADVKDYVLELGPDVKIPGKIFGGQAVGATGGEFSLQVFARARSDAPRCRTSACPSVRRRYR